MAEKYTAWTGKAPDAGPGRFYDLLNPVHFEWDESWLHEFEGHN